MSASSTGIPPLIEQHLLALDKQLREASFVRGAGRLVFGICFVLGTCLLLDSWFDLNGTVRASFLAGWIVAASIFVWRGLILPAVQPVSFPMLAALVEKQFPELRERLTSLVELRGDPSADLAPGASKLMQDLLARQTVKAFDQLSVDQVTSKQGVFQAFFSAIVAVVLLLAPFGWIPGGYGLLWNRFFVPWGNLAWGTVLEIAVQEGDQVIARGTDVTVHVVLSNRKRNQIDTQNHQAPIWLNWNDEKGASDSCRLEWDEECQQFATTIPHIQASLTFQVATDGAKSGTYRVDVSDPPTIAELQIDLEPAAYTGLPAKSLIGFPNEIRALEFTQIHFKIEFNEPVSTADIVWPTPPFDGSDGAVHTGHNSAVEKSIPFELAKDGRSGSVTVTANLSGQFSVLAKNRFALRNTDPPRALIVVPDQPPQFQGNDNEESVLCRPDETVELAVDVIDDFGVAAVELHAETSARAEIVMPVPPEKRREPHVLHTFALDLSPLNLSGDQMVTYRFRAIDNCPSPNTHEVWTKSRSLITNTRLKQLPDPQLAGEEKSLEDELSHLRTVLNKNKSALAELHQQTEKESLDKQPDSNKTEQLDQLKQDQDEVIEQLDRFADRLAERQMTKDLAPQAQKISDEELKAVQERLEQSKGLASRDQLEPFAKSIDQLGAADRHMRQLEQQLNDLNKLEQNLAEMKRMAQRAERLADQLDQLNANENSEKLEQLKVEGQKLVDQMNELLTQHPELLDAARRAQHDQLNNISAAAQKLAEPQARLAQALEKSAANTPTEDLHSQDRKPSENSAKEASQQEGRNVAERQGQIAREATEQAVKLARETGADSEATKAAAEFARKADAAKQLAQSGQLQQAAKEAADGAKSAEQAARELNPDDQSNSPEFQQAQKLAEDQKATAEQMGQHAQSPEAAQGAQMQGQSQLAEAANRLTEQLDEVSNSLKSTPLNSPKDAELSEQAKTSMQQARQAMERSEQANRQNDPQQAAREADEAAEKLKQAAEIAKQTPPPNPHSLPVPMDVGKRVAEVTKRLDAAQQKLSQCNCEEPGSAESEAKTGQSSSAQTESNKAGPEGKAQPQEGTKSSATGEEGSKADSPQAGQSSQTSSQNGPDSSGSPPDSGSPKSDSAAGQKPGQSQLSQAADQFREFAAMLKQSPGLSKAGKTSHHPQQGQKSGKPTPGGSNPGQPESPSEPGEDGADASGANATLDLTHLDAELKQQARQNWGRLPGQLRTEILQGAGKKSHPQYTERIKSYFDEITKPAK